jgi:uncharacterized protein (DUF2062 family)
MAGVPQVFLICSVAAALGLLFYLAMYVFLRRTVPEFAGRTARQRT